jgi:TetR/AcrR family transcriptional regulator
MSTNNGNDRRRRIDIRQANLQRILGAAEIVFSKRGRSGATIGRIAAQAGLPKANVLYYFRSKEQLYRAVIENIVQMWQSTLGDIDATADPRKALLQYLRLKVRLSKARPHASRVFAADILAGAPVSGHFLRTEVRRWVDRTCGVFRQWSRRRQMAAIDGHHLFFLIWAMTQTYADFHAQMAAVLGKRVLSDRDYATAERTIATLVVRGCNLRPRARQRRRR